MNRNIMMCVFILILATLFCYGENVQKEITFERYKNIAAKNIFSRNRTAEKPADQQIEQAEDTRKFVFELFKLRGTAIAGEEKKAFVENVFNNEIFNLTKGEIFEGWKISEISKNDITIQKDDASLTISVGDEFDGDGLIEGDYIAAESERESREQSREPSGDNDVIRRMMERRRQELGN